MPCGAAIRHVLLPSASALVGHSAYEVVPSYDALDMKNSADKRADLSFVSATHPATLNVPAQPVREVLFYASEEEEDVNTSDTSATNTFSVTGVVELPDLQRELREWFPTPQMVSPPPPVASKPVRAMRLWHTHLITHPSYTQCVRIAGCGCPQPPSTQGEEVEHEWVHDCETWWSHLSTCLAKTGGNYRFLSERTWNPYSMTQSLRYTGEAKPACELTSKADMALIHYPLPPPPAFTQATEEYLTITKCATVTLRSFVVAMTVWWRKACEWAAAANQKHSWLSPPPSTGRDAEDWWQQCEAWWTATITKVRKDAEPAPAGTRSKRSKRSKANAHSRHSSDLNSVTLSST